MKPSAAKTQFLKRLKAAGLPLDTITPADGVEAMLAYYAEERADGCPFEEDGDMLLFEWGIYDWGDGPAFEVGITRQLVRTDTKEEEIWQLGLDFRFEPSVGIRAGKQNRWCASLDELDDFRKFITKSAALKAVARHTPMSVELRFGPT
jgi:hypothetical protein